MERCVAAVESLTTPFLRWEEMCAMGENGRKEVRYYLKKRDGSLDLVIVGKEKKLGFLSYKFVNREKFVYGSVFNLKLRSRTEVVDWLNSIVTGIPTPVNVTSEVTDACKLDLQTLKDGEQHKLASCAKEFSWVGSTWTCRKKRKHYPSYRRNGVTISVDGFVYVLAEEGNRLVAYLDDMYEDSRGNKMVVVQWFHKVDEVGTALPHNYNNNREVFFSLCLQHLSIECVDGLASVLSPQHFETFMNEATTYTKYEPFVCHRQFDNDEVKPFDITQVKGYWKQEIIGFISALSRLKSKSKSRSPPDSVVIRPGKRIRRIQEKGCLNSDTFVKKDSENLTIGSKVEVLSQDSGVRGCWFKALIIKKHKDKVKVRYQDVKDAADESINLEEWILASRIAIPDHLGIRLNGRTTVRPAALSDKGNSSGIIVGSVVDAWWHDGWWEGVVVQKDSDERIYVYFPGEKQESVFGSIDLRQSEEWLGNMWKPLQGRPDIVSSIRPCQAVNPVIISKSCDVQTNPVATRDNKEVSLVQKDEPLKSSVGNCNIKESTTMVQDLSKDALLAQLKWNWSRKRRHGRRPSPKRNCSVNKKKNGLKLLNTKTYESFFLRPSLKVDNDNCKFFRESTLFASPVASPLTSLVM